MDRGTSNFGGSKRDLLRRGSSAFLLWCLPWCACASVPNQRFPMRQCSLPLQLGPFFILCAVISLAYGLGLLPLGPSGWKWIGAGTIIGAFGLGCIPELFLGRYRPKGSAA